MNSVFSQMAVLGSSLTLIFGLILLWRRSVHAYVTAFLWQSLVLAGVVATVAYFHRDPELYFVAALLLLLKGLVIPRLLRRMERSWQPRPAGWRCTTGRDGPRQFRAPPTATSARWP